MSGRGLVDVFFKLAGTDHLVRVLIVVGGGVSITALQYSERCARCQNRSIDRRHGRTLPGHSSSFFARLSTRAQRIARLALVGSH